MSSGGASNASSLFIPAAALVWEGMQQTLRCFPQAVVVLELHLQRDPPQTVSLLRRNPPTDIG